MDHPEETSTAAVDARQSPFYEWLNHATIQDLLHRSLEVSTGERLVLIKGLVPGLVEAMGLEMFETFLADIALKARRYQEAADHPGEGRTLRVTPGEKIGGPVPAGQRQLLTPRNPDRRGAREAERIAEGDLWNRTERMARPESGA